jgi:hypothetical protein
LPRLGVCQSTAGRASETVLSGDFTGLVPACSDTHGPEHPRRRGTPPFTSCGRKGSIVSAPDRRDRFDVNCGSGWVVVVAVGGAGCGEG